MATKSPPNTEKTTEERIASLETQMAVYKALFAGASLVIAGLLGAEALWGVPAKVKELIDGALKADVQKEIDYIQTQYAELQNNKDGARKNLGIVGLGADISKAVRLDKTYRLKNGGAGDWVASLPRAQGIKQGDPVLVTPHWNNNADAYWTFVQEDKP